MMQYDAHTLTDVLHLGIRGLRRGGKELQKRSQPCMLERIQVRVMKCSLCHLTQLLAQLGQHVNAGDDKATSKEELGKGRQQVSDSRSRLLKLKAERDLEVSAVRVAGDERESQRRTKEEEERQVL